MNNGTKKFLRLLLVVALSVSVVPVRVFGDDDSKDGSSPRLTSAKPDAPQPGLTERERMLLDRVEQLEKRVAELESKNQPAPTSTSATAEAKITLPGKALPPAA